MEKLVLDHVAGFCQLQQKTPLWVFPGQSSGLEGGPTERKKISNLPFTELHSPHNDAVMHWLLAHCLNLNSHSHYTHYHRHHRTSRLQRAPTCHREAAHTHTHTHFLFNAALVRGAQWPARPDIRSAAPHQWVRGAQGFSHRARYTAFLRVAHHGSWSSESLHMGPSSRSQGFTLCHYWDLMFSWIFHTVGIMKSVSV